MPMPHRTQMQVIKRRLVGKEGGERIKELRTILAELPGYKSGPYADIRKWVAGEIEEAHVRNKAVHRDSIAVRREGVAQIALVGPPNAGKSSLLQALSSIQIKTGDYAFTTTRPVPAVTRIRGVLVQLVEIPGLIEGATDDRGGGRALLGVLRGADAMVLCQDATASLDGLRRCAWSSRSPASTSRRSSRSRSSTRRPRARRRDLGAARPAGDRRVGPRRRRASTASAMPSGSSRG